MWIRKRIEIAAGDLLWGFGRTWHADNPAAAADRLERHWSPAGDAIACLSVRSGFDLVIRAAGWPAGSEVLMTSLTIPDMPRIVRHHGHQPVPIDIEAGTLAPTRHALETAVTERTRALVVAHLFGTRIPLDPIIEFARRHNLLLIEDCAQAFDGDYLGDSRADVSMFSFGPIKACTALQGALLRIRDPHLRNTVRSLHSRWPFQDPRDFRRRLLKYAGIRLISTRLGLVAGVTAMRSFGFSHDRLAQRAARGFGGPGFFERIRRRPCEALLALLDRRLRRFDRMALDQRIAAGRALADELPVAVARPGATATTNSYWVFPVLVEDPAERLAVLWRAGFDAARPSSMCVVGSPSESEPTEARRTFDRLIFLPLHADMPPECRRRMARLTQPP